MIIRQKILMLRPAWMRESPAQEPVPERLPRVVSSLASEESRQTQKWVTTRLTTLMPPPVWIHARQVVEHKWLALAEASVALLTTPHFIQKALSPALVASMAAAALDRLQAAEVHFRVMARAVPLQQ
jgi:hypothetical protein